MVRCHPKKVCGTVAVLENSTHKLICSSSFGNFGGCKGQILMELGYNTLLETFKENNLRKIGFLKLLTKENLFGCFH